MSNLIGIKHPSACAGKQRLNQFEASRAAARMGQKHKEPFTWYKCQVCAAWHIGHSEGFKRTQKKGKNK